MPSYRTRQAILDAARQIPQSIRDRLVEATNSVRLRIVREKKPLRWVTLFITNYCNARCDHCFFWSELNSKKPEMSLDELTRTFQSLRHQLNTIRVSGGEPFLRKDLADFFIAIDRNRLAQKVGIPTHGMLTILPTIQRMLDAQQFSHLNISVSLDGLEERHNAFRKIPNGFAKAVENLRAMVRLQEQNALFNVSVSIALARAIALPKIGEAESEIDRMIRFLRDDVGVSSIGFDFIRSARDDVFDLPADINSHFEPPPTLLEEPGNWHKRTDDVQLNVDEMASVLQRLRSAHGEHFDRLTMRRLEIEIAVKRSRRRIVPCLAGCVDAVVYPTGDVSACEFTKPFANLKDFDFDFEALWHSHEAEVRRGEIQACACTHPCHLSDSMAYDTQFLKEYLAPHE